MWMWAISVWAAEGVTVRTVEWKGARYTVVDIDLDQARIDLYGQRPPGPKTLDAVRAAELAEGRELVVAMNGGMYHPNHRPVGLHVERGEERAPLVRGASAGNFGMLPNAVFVVDDIGAAVVDTEDWQRGPDGVWLATQSGPALVLDGQLHPKFLPDSTSLNLRNGVGVPDPRHVVFAISETGVRFHDFATLFRDALGCPNALYLDGAVSSLHAPGHEQADAAFGTFSSILAIGAPIPIDPPDVLVGALQHQMPINDCFNGYRPDAPIRVALLLSTGAHGQPAALRTAPAIPIEACLREAYLSSGIVAEPYRTFRYPLAITP